MMNLVPLNGWSLAYAQGYVEGKRHRIDKKTPQQYALIGIDEYSAGFRAGYFADARQAPDIRRRGARNHPSLTGPALRAGAMK